MAQQISRDAQVAALTFFMTGADNEATFNPKTIAERTRKALDELVGAGMAMVVISKSNILSYRSLPKIGRPLNQYQPVEEHEAWKATNR